METVKLQRIPDPGILACVHAAHSLVDDFIRAF
jgi:hypothetical protein